MATLYVGGRLFDGEKVQDGHAVLEEGGKVKRVAPAGEFAGFAGDKVDTAGGTLIPASSTATSIRCRAPKAIPASCRIA